MEARPRNVSQGTPTAGRIPNGALVEREVQGSLHEMEYLVLELKNPDFVTATRILDAINRYAGGRYRAQIAFERDFRTIVLSKPRHIGPVRFLAEIGELTVEPDTPARVVINERTGTVVIGRDVRISTVAVTHGNLTVRVTELPVVSQPAPFSKGQTVVVPQTVVEANEAGSQGGDPERRRSPAPGARAEPDRPEAIRHHRDPPGDQDGRRPSGRRHRAMMRKRRASLVAQCSGLDRESHAARC
ncbi:flagellar basal body P-ring protein FlgI [Bradyrhizobium sp. LB1.3]